MGGIERSQPSGCYGALAWARLVPATGGIVLGLSFKSPGERQNSAQVFILPHQSLADFSLLHFMPALRQAQKRKAGKSIHRFALSAQVT
jgi:hypothetical protein